VTRTAHLWPAALTVLGAVACKRAALPAPPPADVSAIPSHATRRPGDLVRFAVFGDYGDGGRGEAEVAALVRKLAPDFIVTTGDNNYPSGEAATLDEHVGRFYAPYIGDYHGAFGPGSPVNRFFPAAGNHDWLSGLEPYLAYFTLPGNERYYELDRGPVDIFVIDTDPAEPDGITASSVQAQWLRAALGRSRACFKVVAGHHPPWSSGPHGSTADVQWPFSAWGVTAAFFGHDHVYERFDVGGTTVITVGIGGAPIYEFVPTVVTGSLVRYNATHGLVLVSVSTSDITFELYATAGDRIDALARRAPAGCVAEK